jgi:hypothetical protein
VAGREQLTEELLRILILISHDTLLHQADLARDLGDHVSFPAGDGETIAYVSPNGEVGRSRPVSIRAATA